MAFELGPCWVLFFAFRFLASRVETTNILSRKLLPAGDRSLVGAPAALVGVTWPVRGRANWPIEILGAPCTNDATNYRNGTAYQTSELGGWGELLGEAAVSLGLA